MYMGDLDESGFSSFTFFDDDRGSVQVISGIAELNADHPYRVYRRSMYSLRPFSCFIYQ